MPLGTSVLTSTSELEALRSAWEALLARSASNEPMLSPLWLLPWWRVFGSLGGRRPAVLACHEGDRLVGLAPLLSRTHRYPPGIPFRRLELLGTGEPEEDEICSEYVGVLAERGMEGQVAAELTLALTRGTLGPWDELVLVSMDGESIMPGLLSEALARAGAEAVVESVGSAPYIALPRSFPQYLGALSSSSRYLVNRSLRDVERWADGDVTLRVASTPAELEEGRRLLLQLHGERWRGGGAFGSPRFRAFHDQVMPALHRRGALSLAWLVVRGAPIAAAYGIVWRSKLYFYQAGRSLDVPRGVRPGIALHASMVRRAIQDGITEYDFLEGHSRYKRQLATSARSLVRLRAARPESRLRERARTLCDRGLSEGRMLLRAIERGGDGPPSLEREPPPEPPVVLHGDLNMLRCFAGSGVRTVVLASDPDAPVFFSRHCGQRRLVSNVCSDPDAALADLLALGDLFEQRPVLYYGDDAMLLLVSRNRDALGARFRLHLPSAELVETLVDKRRFAALAAERALPVPRTMASSEARSAAEIARRLEPPWIVKPSCHLGWRTSKAVLALHIGPAKALRADNQDELSRTIELVETFSRDFVVQQLIPGAEDCVMSFHAYLDRHRRPLGSFVGRKIRTYPRSAGVSTYLELVESEELTRVGLDILDRIGLVGVVKLDFKRDPRTGRFYLLEVNPRFNLWNHLGAAAGVNLPLLAYRDLTGAPASPVRAARAGMRWLSFGDDARAFFRERGPSARLSVKDWLLSLRGPKVYDVFAWDDPAPFLVDVRRELGLGAAR